MKRFYVVGEIDKNVVDRFFKWVDEPSYFDKEPPEVIISSNGGDEGYVVAMYDEIVRQGMNTTVLGIAQGAAAALFQAGAKRSMSQNSLLVFPAPKGSGFDGNLNDQEWCLHSKLADLIIQSTNLEIIEVHDLFDGIYINAHRAVEKGLCDEIQGEPQGEDNGTSNQLSGGEGEDSGYQGASQE